MSTNQWQILWKSLINYFFYFSDFVTLQEQTRIICLKVLVGLHQWHKSKTIEDLKLNIAYFAVIYFVFNVIDNYTMFVRRYIGLPQEIFWKSPLDSRFSIYFVCVLAQTKILYCYIYICASSFYVCQNETSKRDHFAKNVNGYFHKNLHLRCLNGLWIRLRIYLLKQLWGWLNEISNVCWEETQRMVVNKFCLVA